MLSTERQSLVVGVGLNAALNQVGVAAVKLAYHSPTPGSQLKK